MCVSPPVDPSEKLHAAAGAGVGSREWDQPGGGSRGLQRGLERSGDARAHLHTGHPESTAPLQQWVWTRSAGAGQCSLKLKLHKSILLYWKYAAFPLLILRYLMLAESLFLWCRRLPQPEVHRGSDWYRRLLWGPQQPRGTETVWRDGQQAAGNDWTTSYIKCTLMHFSVQVVGRPGSQFLAKYDFFVMYLN